jgi:hypothetical protein
VRTGGVVWSRDSVRRGAVLRSGVVPEIHVKLSEEAHDGWTRFAIEQGVTITALVELLGRRMADGKPVRIDDRLVRDARALAHERRRAGGPRKR